MCVIYLFICYEMKQDTAFNVMINHGLKEYERNPNLKKKVNLPKP